MAWSDLFTALALVIIVEGLFPFLNPEGWKSMMKQVAKLENSQLRNMGLVMIVIGSLLLFWVRG